VFRPGVHNHLRALRKADHGWYLGNEQESVLLPNRYAPEDLQEGDRLRVFLYFDSEDRLIATTLEPLIRCEEFAVLECIDVNDKGAFMDWGLPKDLLIPVREQETPLKKGEKYVVYMYLDESSNRLVGSTRLRKYLEAFNGEWSEGDEVEALLYSETDLGWNAVVEGRFAGLLYRNKISRVVQRGSALKVLIEKIREDGKLDLAMNAQGYERISTEAERLLELIRRNNGFLNLHDKSSPEEVRKIAGMSKKTFKMAVGQLYKKRLIELSPEGISLIEQA